jgi:hypothetical protein
MHTVESSVGILRLRFFFPFLLSSMLLLGLQSTDCICCNAIDENCRRGLKYTSLLHGID